MEAETPQAEIIRRPPMKFVGLETRFISVMSDDANNFEVLGALWNRVCQLAEPVPHRKSPAMYGVCKSVPESERTHPHQFWYLAGFEVEHVGELSDPLVAVELPETTFARFIHRGPLSQLGETIGYIYRDWLPESGYRHSDVADVELYDRRFEPGSDSSEMEYWISVEPLESSPQ